MDLSKFAKIGEVKQLIEKYFTIPPPPSNDESLAPRKTNNPRLIGTAFDYLMRFIIERKNKNSISSNWTAENFKRLLRGMMKYSLHPISIPSGAGVFLSQEKERFFRSFEKIDPSLSEQDKLLFIHQYIESITDIITVAKEDHAWFLKKGKITPLLLRSAFFLASIEHDFKGKTFSTTFKIEINDIDDLQCLVSLIKVKDFTAKNKCILNPHFGPDANVLMNADADLVIDDKLIDIKTVKDFERFEYHLYQLIGYHALYRIGGIKGMDPKNDIRQLGIYYSRHGWLYLINIHDMIDEESLNEFIEKFIEIAKKYKDIE